MNGSFCIAVVGSGYVGLVAAACFAEIGHTVICVDNDEAKVAMLREGGVPIHEEYLKLLLDRYRETAITFTTDLRGATRDADAIFIAVGTPQSGTGSADLSYVDAVASEIARSIDRYKVIVEKSTVPVYTNEWIRRVVERNGVPRELFDVASNPEFLREGTAVSDFLHTDRIVVGTDSIRAATLMSAIYEPLTSGRYYASATSIPGCCGQDAVPPLLHVSTKAAELIKHASNAFLAVKISFINTVANICEAVGADVEQVARGIGMDKRIGSRFLQAGVGYGGSCFPKDVAAFRYVAEQSKSTASSRKFAPLSGPSAANASVSSGLPLRAEPTTSVIPPRLKSSRCCCAKAAPSMPMIPLPWNVPRRCSPHPARCITSRTLTPPPAARMPCSSLPTGRSSPNSTSIVFTRTCGIPSFSTAAISSIPLRSPVEDSPI
jgi:UDP-glucose 6-dehydrogenase